MILNRPPLVPMIHSGICRRFKARTLRFESPRVCHTRQLLVDVSVIVRQDARTGIQRVVRALLGQLVAKVSSDVLVQPVFASRDHGYCRATITSDGRLVNASSSHSVLQPVTARRGDVFLGLDLTANILPYAEADLARWRREGVTINFMIYDLLPVIRPDWFPRRTARNFKRWLGVLARQADCCICISDAVAADLAHALMIRAPKAQPRIATIPLGADLVSSHPSRGLPEGVEDLREWLKRHRVLLSVGTIEPRKGHDCLLAGLTELWKLQPNGDTALLLVGRPGWKTKELQHALRDHPEFGRRLRWLDEASDELLAELYASAAGLVSASRGEGFGLPLIEALAHGIPVLARDLPVFREVGGSHFDYFDEDTPGSLASRIEEWMDNASRPTAATIAALPSWANSAVALAHCIGIPDAILAESCRA